VGRVASVPCVRGFVAALFSLFRIVRHASRGSLRQLAALSDYQAEKTGPSAAPAPAMGAFERAGTVLQHSDDELTGRPPSSRRSAYGPSALP